VALALHGDAEAIASTARTVAELTHSDPLAGDSCVLWCLAIDAALRGAAPDPAAHVDALPAQRRDQWAAWIDAADGVPPSTFADNGYTVTALQAAWAGIRQSKDRGVTSYLRMIDAASARAAIPTRWPRSPVRWPVPAGAWRHCGTIGSTGCTAGPT